VKSFIALFRGINIGGHNILPMKELVTLLQELDLHNITTYIQSGNVIFQSKAHLTAKLAGHISSEIQKRYGFEPKILLLEKKDLVRAVQGNPFPEAASKPETLCAIFLFTAPSQPDLGKMAEIKIKSERFALVGKVFYLHAPDGFGRSKLAANVERLLGVETTGRNWKTLCRLLSIVNEYP
jgi:uncharacterized protein (DUF1697 family)